MGIDDYIGQQKIREYFKRAKSSARFHHCCIIEGQTGLGKRTLIQHLIKLINCPRSTEDYCGVCPMCMKISRDHFADLFVLEPLEGKKNISIKQVRDFQPVMHYPPVEGGTRIIVINRVEDLSIEAQNALLKSLEEPPARNMFFLLTENRTMFLDTILSRGELLTMAPLSTQDVTAVLRALFPNEDDARVVEVAKSVGGNPGLAVRILTDDLVDQIRGHVEGVFSGSAEDAFDLAAMFTTRSKLRNPELFQLVLDMVKKEILLRHEAAPGNNRPDSELLNIYREADTVSRLAREINLHPEISMEYILLSVLRVVSTDHPA